MEAVRQAFGKIIEEIRIMWFPFVGIIMATICTILCGSISDNLQLRDIITQLVIALIWITGIYTLGGVIRNKKNETSNKTVLYILIGMIAMCGYGFLELFFICQYTGLTINF